jgi:hypothetical protein
MSELHWTGAALLLAIAVLGGKSARPRPRAISASGKGTRRARAGRAVTLTAERPEQSPRRILYRAETTCLHCGWTAGELEWDAAAPADGIWLRPATAGTSRRVPLGRSLRCGRCDGPLFAEAAQRVVERCTVKLEQPARGRPRKTTTLRAS